MRLGVAGFSVGSTEACSQLGGSLHAGDAIPPAGCQSLAARVPLPLPDWSLSECDGAGGGGVLAMGLQVWLWESNSCKAC